MNSGEQSQIATRADVELMKEQLNQLVEAMTTLARKEDHNAQAQPVQIPVENPTIQEHSVIRGELSSSLDATDYQGFAFSVPDFQGAVPVMGTKDPRAVEFAERYRVLDERLKAMEERDTFGLDASSMCLVPGLVLPPKFKAPKFEKYKGDSCPKQHLVMFCRKMTSYVGNDKLMVHSF